MSNPYRATSISRCRIHPVATAALLAPALLATITRPAQAQPASLDLASRAYVRVPTGTEFNLQQFTLSVWLRPDGPGENGGGTLVSKSGRPASGSNLCSWWMGWAASSGRVLGLVVHEFAVSGRLVTSNAIVPLGQQAHAALTFDGSTLRLYINGVLDQQEPFGFSGVYSGTEDVLVGAFNPGTGYTFNRFDGQLDDVSIWDRALSDNEIGALARCEPSAGAAGLVAHLPFTGSTLDDASGHGHNGVAVGVIGFGPQASGLGAGVCCRADFNADGELNADDLGDFITCYFSTPPCPGAEFNADGGVNADDLGDFITAYFSGCV